MNTTAGRRVVVGIDGSDSAVRAVRWAAKEARRRSAGLRLVHAVEVLTGFAPHVVDWHAVQTAMQDRGREWLDEARDAARQVAPEVHVDTSLAEVYSVVALVRESQDAALVVLGSRGLGGFTGLVLGSTAVELAGRAYCPIVVIRGGPDGEVVNTGPVVVGVDGTPVGEDAIAFAYAQASARGAELVAVHAWSDLILEAAYTAGGAPALDFSRLQRQSEELLAERLAGWQEKYPDVHVVREVVHDRPTRALLRHAAHAQLLVVGTRGRGGFRGLLLGSTSQHMLYHAACPVAVVRTAVEH
jgi:nucleotide-binding universal stress UspA family protein